jgi:hypothetical protein
MIIIIMILLTQPSFHFITGLVMIDSDKRATLREM